VGNVNVSENYPPTKVSLAGIATNIAAGIFNACASLSSGAVWCWGDNGYGQLGNGTVSSLPTAPAQVATSSTTKLANVQDVAYNGMTGIATLNDGRVFTWGYNYHGGLGLGSTDLDGHPFAALMTNFTCGNRKCDCGENHATCSADCAVGATPAACPF
jgi:alpha-tubulin suppressor-like RCC1 family protein